MMKMFWLEYLECLQVEKVAMLAKDNHNILETNLLQPQSDDDVYDGVSRDQLTQLRAEEARAVVLAENKKLDQALAVINDAMSRCANIDSLHNNRSVASSSRFTRNTDVRVGHKYIS
jgi:hypothetical protein